MVQILPSLPKLFTMNMQWINPLMETGWFNLWKRGKISGHKKTGLIQAGFFIRY
jgi:hypothetical protein